MKETSDNAEQYQGRFCLRINGIDSQQECQIETGEECLQKVKNVFNELKIEIPSTVIAQDWQGRKGQRRTRSADDSAFYHMAAQNHGVQCPEKQW